MIKSIGWFVFFLLLTAACLDNPDCYSLNNHIVGISFKKLSDRKADTVFVHSLTAAGIDSIFRKDKILTGADLPLNYYEDETTFYFDGLSGRDSLRLGYSARPQFVSAECGERFVLLNLHVISHSFDSVRIVNAIPKKDRIAGANLEIYRCPATNTIKVRFATSVKITSIATDYPTAILYTAGKAVTTLNIPLNTAVPTSTIEFTFQDGTVRYITLTYSRSEDTLFSTCGPQTILSDFEVVSTSFSAVTVARDSIQDPPLTNIEITP